MRLRPIRPLRPLRLAIIALAAGSLAACVWTSDKALFTPGQAAAVPLKPGTYRQGLAGQPDPQGKAFVVTRVNGRVATVSIGDEQDWTVSFLKLDHGFYIAAATNQEGWVYELVRPVAGGFDYLPLDCDPALDRRYALDAGATLQSSDDVCVFASLAQLRAAATAVAAAALAKPAEAPLIEHYYRAK
jgi:hypothetical protein